MRDTQLKTKDYLNSIILKAQEAEDTRAKEQVQKRFQKYDFQFQALACRIDEADKLHENFEDKTEANFKIAEEMLLVHSNRFDQLDGQFVTLLSILFAYISYLQNTEILLVKSTFQNLDERITSDFNYFGHHINIQAGVLNNNMRDKVTELTNNVINRLNNQVEDLKQALKLLRQENSVLIEEFSQKIDSKSEDLELLKQKILFYEHNSDVITEILQKHTKRIDKNEEVFQNTKSEVASLLEARHQTFTATQKVNAFLICTNSFTKAVEQNIAELTTNRFNELSAIIEHIQNAGVKPDHMQDIKRALAVDISSAISNKVPQLVERQSRAIVQEEVNSAIENSIVVMVETEIEKLSNRTIPKLLDERSQQLTLACHKFIQEDVPIIIQQRVPEMIDPKISDMEWNYREDLDLLKQEQGKHARRLEDLLQKKSDHHQLETLEYQIQQANNRFSSEDIKNLQKVKSKIVYLIIFKNFVK